MGGYISALDELEKVKLYDREAEKAINEIERLDTMINRITGCTDKVVVQGGSNEGFYRSIDKLCSLQQTGNRVIDRYIDYRELVKQRVSELDDPLHYELLYGLYLDYDRLDKLARIRDCTPMDILADELHYSCNYLYTIRRNALEAYAEKHLNES